MGTRGGGRGEDDSDGSGGDDSGGDEGDTGGQRKRTRLDDVASNLGISSASKKKVSTASTCGRGDGGGRRPKNGAPAAPSPVRR
jgi:hypothetical protein